MSFDSKTAQVVNTLIGLHNTNFKIRSGLDEIATNFCEEYTQEVDKCVLKIFDILFEYPPKKDIEDTIAILKKNNPEFEKRIKEIIEPIMVNKVIKD